MGKRREAQAGTVEIRRSGERIETSIGWLEALSSFPMGHHPPDPANTHFGLLYVHQEDRIAPRSGFPLHPHREVEVVTWMLEGRLRHRDSQGGEGVIGPGQAQHMSAGAGIRHSEMNPFDERTHLLQMWIEPDRGGGEPYYSDIDLGTALEGGELVPVASGRESEATATMRQRDATLWVARPLPGTSPALPEAPFLHLFCARGSLTLEGAGALSAGDAARLRDAGARRITPGAEGCELLAWEMHSELGPSD
jgi:hypothetical protein